MGAITAPGPRVVALGGGHGLAASLSALRRITDRITAVVTVADDGGSSGRLRSELGVLPPGDLRMALSALCDDSEWGRTWRDLLQYRFTSHGDLDQHAVGNLLIVALWNQLGDTVAGLDWVGRLLGARGRVLPMASVPLEIEADVLGDDGERLLVRGQSLVAVAQGQIENVRLIPGDPPACPEAVDAVHEADWVVLGPGSWYTSVLPHLLVPADPPACPEAVDAVHEADWVVLGPGSWYTSVVPHLLVPEITDALLTTRAGRLVNLNLAPAGETETEGMGANQLLAVVHDHAPALRIDVVIADPRSVEDVHALEKQAESLGARLLLRQVGVGDGSPRHDPLRLAAAFGDAFETFLGDVGTVVR